MTKRLLVVDDEESLRELIATCLEDLGGWEVLVAKSGNEGLLQAASTPIDAILLDVSMPDMDGFHFYQRLKQNPAMQAIPIILLTAKVLPSDRTRFAQMDLAGIITKPFQPTQICEQVAALLGWNGSAL